MPDPKDAFSTLDDFLLSLADGVSHAQAEAARAGAAGPPGAQVQSTSSRASNSS